MAGVDRRELVRREEEGEIPRARRNDRNHRVYSFEEARAVIQGVAGSRHRSLAVVNQKGGVGKTTTALNLAGALVARGRKVLAVDLDPQANLTSSLGVELEDRAPTVEEVLVQDDLPAEEALQKTRFPGLHVLPARPRMAGVEIKIFDAFMRESILDRKVEPLRERFDFVLMDCPPNLSLITVNALVACEEALVPIEAQPYSIKAISDLSKTVALIRTRLGKGVRLRILPTKFDGRIKVAKEILQAVRSGLKERVLPAIRTDAHLVRAPMMKAPIEHCFPSSKGARDYGRLADLLLREPAEPDAEDAPQTA